MKEKTDNIRALQYVATNILMDGGMELTEIALLFDVEKDYLVSLREEGI